MDPPSKHSTRKWDFPQPILPILPYHFHYSLHGGVNVWLGPFRVLSDWVLRDRVLFRVLSDRVIFRALSDRILFRVLSSRVLFRVLFRVLSDRVLLRVLFRFLLRVLSDSVLIRVLSPRFMLCAISCINNLRGFAMIFCFKHFNSNRCFDSFLGKFNAINGNLGKFLKREKRLYPRFLTGFWIHLCRDIYVQKYSSTGIPKDGFSKRFFKVATKVSLTGYFSKKSSYMDLILWKSFLWCFLNSYIKDYLRVF